MNNEMRKEFEKAYPTPEGVAWNPDIGEYVLFHSKWCTLSCHSAYCAKWTAFSEGWRASREHLVIELPVDLNNWGDGYYQQAIDEVKVEIEQQGVKWK